VWVSPVYGFNISVVPFKEYSVRVVLCDRYRPTSLHLVKPVRGSAKVVKFFCFIHGIQFAQNLFSLGGVYEGAANSRFVEFLELLVFEALYHGCNYIDYTLACQQIGYTVCSWLAVCGELIIKPPKAANRYIGGALNSLLFFIGWRRRSPVRTLRSTLLRLAAAGIAPRWGGLRIRPLNSR